MRTKQRNNLAETARHERVAQNTDVYAVKARNYKGLRRGSPVLCRNNWHIHHAKSGGGQILVCVAGRGYYQVDKILCTATCFNRIRWLSAIETVNLPDCVKYLF